MPQLFLLAWINFQIPAIQTLQIMTAIAVKRLFAIELMAVLVNFPVLLCVIFKLYSSGYNA